MADDVAKKAPLRSGNEIGVTGLKVFSGVTQEEFQVELVGQRGTKTLKRMSTSDPVIKAVLRAITLVLRGVKWRVEPADDSKAAADEAAFVESLMDDMSHTWEDFISEVLSMLVYGWSYHEVILKSRIGPLEADPSKRSKFTDGRIGIRKIAPRSQDSLLKWDMQEDGGIAGLWQQPITGGQYYIPIEKALLFRTVSYKNSPEGESIIRAAYESWYHATNIRNFESVGIERELAGLPVISIPAHYLSASASADEVAMRNQYEKMARDVKFNEQGGLVIPSNVYADSEGKLSSTPLVKIELLSSGGKRNIDTSAVIQRHQRDIARSVLAEFVMLGGDAKGSYAMSKDKTDFFLQACESIINQIAAPINRFLLPRVWDYNGLDRALLPYVRSEPLAAKDLAALGAYIQALSAAGAPLFPDQELDAYLREVADLPPPAPDAADRQQKEIDQANNPPPPPKPGKPGDDPNKPAGADDGNGGTQKRARPFDKKYNPDQPRDPGGDGGGQWVASGAAGDAGGVSPPVDVSSSNSDLPKKTKKKPKKEDFDNAKIIVSPDMFEQVSNDWAEHIDASPEDFKKQFLGGVNATMSIRRNMGGRWSIAGNVLGDEGRTIGTYERKLDFKAHTAESAFFQLSSGSRDNGLGKKVLAGNVATYQKLGITDVAVHANIDVGGYAWAKYGYVPTQSSWDALRGQLRDSRGRFAGNSNSGSDEDGYKPESWDEISEDDQSNIRDRWKNETFSEFLDSEQQSYRENGTALDDAKRNIAGDFSPHAEWAQEALQEVRDSGVKIPYTDQQVLEALSVAYQDGYDGRGNFDVSFDDEKLRAPNDKPDPNQMSFVGMKPGDLSSHLTSDMRSSITDAITSAFEKHAESEADGMDAPDYLSDSVHEYQSDYWEQMDSEERYRVAQRHNLLPRIPIHNDDDLAEEFKPAPVSDDIQSILNDRNPKAIWRLADTPAGKSMLLGTDWYGHLNLNDADSYNRFSTYVGK